MRFILRLSWIIFLVLTLVFLAGFVTANHTQTSLLLWPTQMTISGEVWMFVLGAFGLGVIVGASLFWLRSLSLRASLWSKTRQIAELESRIEAAAQSDNDNSLPDRYGRFV